MTDKITAALEAMPNKDSLKDYTLPEAAVVIVDWFSDHYDEIKAALQSHAEAAGDANLRLMVRRLAVRLPKDDKVRLQAEDYLRRTFKVSEILRDDEKGSIQAPQPQEQSAGYDRWDRACEEFERHFAKHHLDFSTDLDAWGREKYKHSHIAAMATGWDEAREYYALQPSAQPDTGQGEAVDVSDAVHSVLLYQAVNETLDEWPDKPDEMQHYNWDSGNILAFVARLFRAYGYRITKEKSS